MIRAVLDDDTTDSSWRDFCEDGSMFDLDPEDYATEEEYDEALEEAKEKVAWRATCEDGSDVFIDPEDYDTEEEYDEALEKARNAWRYTVDDGTEYELDPDDFETEEEYNEALDKLKEIKEKNYPNQRRYRAAYDLADGFLCNRDKACCQFIVDNADKITAANYLSYEDGFLYAQAIKDNFKLPVSLPDEDEYREYELSDVLCKIAKRNIALSFEVWDWALTTFLPYTQYADGSLNELTSFVIDDLDCFPENYRADLVRYMDKHSDFMKKVLDKKAEMPSDLDMLIADALQNGLMDVALTLFKLGLVQAGNDWRKINKLTDGTIFWCKNDELESAEYFKLNMLPLVKAINIEMVQDEMDKWEKDLDEYISQAESDCKKSAYTRKNAWRKTVPDGSQYGLAPCYYDSEQEYMEALNKEKYGWREWYKNDDALGLDLTRFETEEEYRKAYGTLLNKKRQ